MNVIIAAAGGGFTDMLRETAETFGWNPWLFLSQVISFVIVALLLRRFAYKPILAVLEERRRRIEEGQLNAEKIKTGTGRSGEALPGDSGQGQRRRAKNDRRSAAKAAPIWPSANSRKRSQPPSKSWPKRAKPARSSMSARWRR